MSFHGPKAPKIRYPSSRTTKKTGVFSKVPPGFAYTGLISPLSNSAAGQRRGSTITSSICCAVRTATLCKMSDLELRKFGRSARLMANPTKNFGTPNPAFKVLLDEARAEWRSRHPKLH
jgi:hypothetical protein